MLKGFTENILPRLEESEYLLMAFLAQLVVVIDISSAKYIDTKNLIGRIKNVNVLLTIEKGYECV
ncbi:MAG: hypothetical protein WAK17_21915 [Candidatus Nitrosopolaris sp.]